MFNHKIFLFWSILLEKKDIEKNSQLDSFFPLETDEIYNKLEIKQIYRKYLFDRVLRKAQAYKKIDHSDYDLVIFSLNAYYNKIVARNEQGDFPTVFKKLLMKANTIIHQIQTVIEKRDFFITVY